MAILFLLHSIRFWRNYCWYAALHKVVQHMIGVMALVRQYAVSVKPFNQYLRMCHIVDTVEAAVSLTFGQGQQVEHERLMQLIHTPQPAALSHLFFAERAAGKIEGLERTPPRALSAAGVIGPGTMGIGIAMALPDAGLTVTLGRNADPKRRDRASRQRPRHRLDCGV